MNLLLDTHVLLWWLQASPNLGRHTRGLIADPSSAVWVSAVSAWEIALKAALGRLDLEEPPEICIPREMERHSFQPLPVSVAHALAVRTLPPLHADPFDHLLIAQARLEGLTLATADRVLMSYEVSSTDASR